MSIVTLPTNFKENSENLLSLPYSFISIIGADAEKFLQGQVSCDVSKLNDTTVSYGTANSAKGRMYGLFKIARINNGFLLRMENSCAKAFIDYLAKYSVFFKAELKLDKSYSAFGLLSPMANGPKESGELTVKNEDLIHRCKSKEAMFEIWSKSILDEASTISAEKWFVQETLNGIPEIYSATQEKFILQHLNLQHLGAVSFNKGCYTGQEIIARMKFRGTLKKKTFLLRATDKAMAPAGSKLMDKHGNKCGELVRSHWSEASGSVALGVLDTRYLEDSKYVSLEPKTLDRFLVSELDYD